MDKEFIAMRKKGFVYDYGLQKWVKEPVGMYGDPALAQLFRPKKYAPGVTTVASAEPDSGLESVPAVESNTQPRG